MKCEKLTVVYAQLNVSFLVSACCGVEGQVERVVERLLIYFDSSHAPLVISWIVNAEQRLLGAVCRANQIEIQLTDVGT